MTCVADADFERRGFTTQARGHQLQRHFVAGDEETVLVEEGVEDLAFVHAERAQDDGDRQLAAAVDTREHGVLRVELEVEPRAAIGNDARGEQQLARAVALATVVVEEHAGRAMQLRNDDALGAVDDERAVVGHERQFAEVDLLLAHVLDGLLGARGFLVEHDETNLDAQRRGIGEATQLALFHVENGVTEAIAHVLQDRVARIAGDREHGLESRMQADVLALLFGLVGLEEGAVGIELDGEQVRRLEDAALLAKVLADALFLGEGISHRSCSWAAAAARPIKSTYYTNLHHQIAGGRPLWGRPPAFLSSIEADATDQLLDLDLRASVFELLLHGFGIGLVDTLP